MSGTLAMLLQRCKVFREVHSELSQRVKKTPKQWKFCGKQLATRQIQIKTIMWYHFIPTRIKKSNRVYEKMENSKFAYTAGRNRKLYKFLQKQAISLSLNIVILWRRQFYPRHVPRTEKKIHTKCLHKCSWQHYS